MGKNGIYDAPKQLGWGKTLVLGIQHIFAMFGATVLVPLLTGLSVQVTLFCAGVGTLIFHLITRGKVPAFLGSSFAFLSGFYAISGAALALESNPGLTNGVYAGLSLQEKLPYALGGVVVAGAVYLVLAGIITLVGVKKVLRFIPPIVTGPIIILIGLNLAGTAVSSASTNWALAALAIATIIVCNIWAKGMIKIVPILMGILVPYIVAACCGLVDFSALSAAGAVGVPHFILPKFDISAILIMAPISLATMMEHIGDISAISATVGKDFKADPGLNRTLLGDGLATMFAGMCGGPANTTYGENTAVLSLSKVYDPKVIRIAAYGAVVLSFSPWFEKLVGTIPGAIMGGVSFVLYGMISAVGVRNMVENRIDMTKSRNLIIAAVVLVSGLGFESYPITFAIGGATLTFKGLASAAILGILLNAILPGKDEDSGVPLMELGAEQPEEAKEEAKEVVAAKN
ncbi:MAG: uracil-xanthine permease family protein [Oscillospiraceae bacterium]|nr:uracil-xanthine permease family protein [Oscillospiraceae bacterium]